MAKSIQQIQQDLDALKAIVGEAGQELQDLYISYLNLLSQSTKQQLIAASYYICTQIYPESFLKLSFSNKQRIQQKLRELGTTIQPQLLDVGDRKEFSLASNELNLVAEMLKNLPLSSKAEAVKEDKINLELVKAEIQELEISEIQTSSDADLEETENLDNDIDSEPINQKQEVDFNNPEHLILWHKQIEASIRKVLDRSSKQANKYLQKSGVIPSRIPAKVMDIAMKAEESASKGGNKVQNRPNILNLIIETDKEKRSPSSSIAQISLLRLRLSELEFIDPLLSAKRTQIRTLIGKIERLKRQYREQKREYARAEAEAAWRSCWYED